LKFLKAQSSLRIIFGSEPLEISFIKLSRRKYPSNKQVRYRQSYWGSFRVFVLFEVLKAFFPSSLAIFGQSGSGKVLILIIFCFI
jgi:hypothetical protein